MKTDFSANLYQKCLIVCSKMLLNVLRNTSLKVLLPWQHTRHQTPVASQLLQALSFIGEDRVAALLF